MAHFIDVEANTKIFVRDVGSGKPIVFISGWPQNSMAYEYQLTQLPWHGYHCFGVDTRGFGRSDWPWGDYNYNIFADDLHKVLRALNLQDVTLVGHSMGGAIVLRYLTRHFHERVSRAILIGAAAPCWTKRPGYQHGWERSVVDKLIEQVSIDRPQLDVEFEKIFFKTEDAISQPLMQFYHGINMMCLPRAQAECLKELRDADLRAELPEIKVPIALFHGVHDKVCPIEFVDELQKGLTNSPHVRVVRFENSGHGPFVEERVKCNEEIRRFIEETSRVATPELAHAHH